LRQIISLLPDSLKFIDAGHNNQYCLDTEGAATDWNEVQSAVGLAGPTGSAQKPRTSEDTVGELNRVLERSEPSAGTEAGNHKSHHQQKQRRGLWYL